MTAREQFKFGDRVTLTTFGLKLLNGAAEGTVVGFGSRANVVKVQRDGESAEQATEYHKDYWRKVEV